MRTPAARTGQLREQVVDWAYAAGWGLVGKAPERLVTTAFRMAADVAARRGGAGAVQLRRNLARVVPQASPAELDVLVRDGLRSYARYWYETFRLPAMDHQRIQRSIDDVVTGLDGFEAVLARGKGLIIVLPHMGNFEAAGVWLVGRCGTFTTVAERLRPESLFQRFLAYREGLGFEILPTTGGKVLPYRVMLERLRAGRVVCLLGDRELGNGGIPVTFFGEQAKFPAGPARLAAATGAGLLPAGLSFTGRGWGLSFHDPIEVSGLDEVPAATQRVADCFAADIAANPADWHMLQKVWVADLPPPRRLPQEPAAAREAG